MFKVICSLCLTIAFSALSAAEFTVSSYNCGGLSDHYDYLRAGAMQKLVREREATEPKNMALNEKIQKLALKVLFAKDEQEKLSAQQQWDRKGYRELAERLTAAPTHADSPNAAWAQKTESTITPYQVRPIVIHDPEVQQMLDDHADNLLKGKEVPVTQRTQMTRAIMAQKIFAEHLKFDIICLQEADYLDASMFPEQYQVLFGDKSHSVNGLAWNTARFELEENIGDIEGKAFAVQLRDRESGKTVLVASGHITGCSPYRIEGNDSAKGDAELQKLVQVFEDHPADIKVMGMDSNVTALHPRLRILKDAGYQLDYKNHLEPTCTNPHQVLNTRIDWIVLKAEESEGATITNLPVSHVGLNNIQTNISDHKPIATKIAY